MQDVGVMPLLSSSLHPRLPETLHDHGRVAMNGPVLRRLLKQQSSRWTWGDVVLSVPPGSWDIHAQQFSTCWKQNKGK